MAKEDTKPTRAAERSSVHPERRFLSVPVEVRAGDDGNKKIIGTIPYNVVANIGGWFREVIRPGFFSRAIEDEHDVVAWYQHGSGGQVPLGRTTADPPTLRLSETTTGLRFEIDPPDTADATAIVVALERGDIKESSFAFIVNRNYGGKERWTEETDQLPLRELLEVGKLVDVSPVAFGAYPTSTASLRSAEDVFAEFRESNESPVADDPPAPDPAEPTEEPEHRTDEPEQTADNDGVGEVQARLARLNLKTKK